MTQPEVKLTVGIPTFNRAEWLGESIKSVLAQPFASFRLIVSDNASDDDTPNVVRSFSDDRISYARSERNVGAIGNLNRLIALAETEFLVLLPDDDVLYPGHLAATVDLLEQFETVGLAHSAFNFIDDRSRVIRRVDTLASRSPVTIERHRHALERLMVSHVGLCFPSVAYRTRAIVEAGGFREEEEPFGDRQLWMRMALDWDFGYIAEPLAGFRLHPDTITTNVGAREGVTPNVRERFLLHSQINFQRRMDFLADAPLDSGTTKRLRALGTLQLIIENAGDRFPRKDVAAHLLKLFRMYPQIMTRPALWRLVAAQLGGRRARAAVLEIRKFIQWNSVWLKEPKDAMDARRRQ